MKLGLFFLSVLGMVAGVAVETSSLLGNVLSPIPSGIAIHTLGNIVKNSNSTKSFVEALSEADPDKVREIIALLEQLAAASLSKKGDLETAVSDAGTALAAAESSLNHANQEVVDADSAVADATYNLGTAQANLAQAEADKVEAEGTKVDKEAVAATAESNRDTAQTAKDTADKALEDQGPGYDDEHAIIFQVIQMLKDLIGEKGGYYIALRLVFTENHGGPGVCANNLKLTLDGVAVPFPVGTTVTDTGYNHSGRQYSGPALIPGVNLYYCSEHLSCNSGICDETVTFTMPTAIIFNEYSLTQADGMPYNPKSFTLEGKQSDSSKWQVISSVTNFDFKYGETVTWKTNA